MLGLALIAPVLAGSLDQATHQATLAGTGALLDAHLALTTKIPLAWEVRNEIEGTPAARCPTSRRRSSARAPGNKDVAAAEASMTGAIEGILTRAFRSAFLVAALLAVAALLPVAVLLVRTRRAGGVAPPSRRPALAAVLGLLVVAGGVLVVETPAPAPPTTAGTPALIRARRRTRPTPATASTASSNASPSAASTGRRASCSESGGARPVARRTAGSPTWHWDRATVEQAIRAGTLRAIDDGDDRNSLPAWSAWILRNVVEHAPIGWMLDRLPF